MIETFSSWCWRKIQFFRMHSIPWFSHLHGWCSKLLPGSTLPFHSWTWMDCLQPLNLFSFSSFLFSYAPAHLIIKRENKKKSKQTHNNTVSRLHDRFKQSPYHPSTCFTFVVSLISTSLLSSNSYNTDVDTHFSLRINDYYYYKLQTTNYNTK